MFNTPRAGGSLVASNMLPQSEGGFADPLAPSTGGFGDVDPWSGMQSPVRSSTPQISASEATNSVDDDGPFLAVDAFIRDPPESYISLLRQLDPSSSGEVSLPAIQKLLASSRLSASTTDKIITITGRDKTAISRDDFFRTLALVAFAQSQPGHDLSLSELDSALPNVPPPRFDIAEPAVSPQRPAPVSHMSSTFSPWDTAPRYPAPGGDEGTNGSGGDEANGSGNPEADAERGYWRRVETIDVELIPEREGWFLQKYRVSSNRRSEALSRRYSDFTWLHTTLLQRYPFRLLPSLPPKRISPDATFLEKRRQGLRRFINAVVNHPVIRDDGALNVFMTEPNFEAWRKRVKVSTEEESASKRLNTAQEMAIPGDLEDKLDGLRTRLPGLIASYQKMVTLAERDLQRIQMSSAEATRFAMSMQAVAEDMPAACYRCVPGGKSCDMCQGTSNGLGSVGEGWSRLANHREKDAATVAATIQAVKQQRELYTAFRDLFIRHARLSHDAVDTLRKKVEQRQAKIETLRAAQKPGWEGEVGKLVSAVEQDNTTIGNLLARRVFIRACLWHELSVVLHSRQAAQATLTWRAWASGGAHAATSEARIWDRLNEELEQMPLE